MLWILFHNMMHSIDVFIKVWNKKIHSQLFPVMEFGILPAQIQTNPLSFFSFFFLIPSPSSLCHVYMLCGFPHHSQIVFPPIYQRHASGRLNWKLAFALGYKCVCGSDNKKIHFFLFPSWMCIKLLHIHRHPLCSLFRRNWTRLPRLS